MTFIDWLQLWAYGGSLLGLWLTGRKSIWAPVIGALGFIPWSLMAWLSGLHWMVGFNAFMSGIHVRNLILWCKDSHGQTRHGFPQGCGEGACQGAG